MISSLRGARHLRSQPEITVTGRRVTFFVLGQVLLLGAAFGGGYALRGEDGRSAAPAARVGDSLSRMDAADVRDDYRYHEVLTGPDAKRALSTAAASPILAPSKAAPPRAEAPRASEARAASATKAPAAKAAPVKPRTLPARALAAARPPRLPDAVPEADESELRVLEAQMKRLARKSARTRGAARPASTDDELHEAIGEAQ